MDGWPDYWPGLPPMWYATHCVSPCLAILGKHAKHVVCHGSGRIREELIGRYGSPFAIETATFAIKDSDVAAEVTRSLFDVARQYRESFDAYGSKKSFEWQQVENEDPVIHTKSTPERPLAEPEIPKRVKVPDYAHLFRSRFAGLPSRRRSRTPSTFRSCKGVVTADRTRTWFMRSCRPSKATARPFPMPRPRRTGPWSVSVPTNPRSKGGEKIEIPTF